ncbi:M56 family metallopeptidase [Daejeonella sp.]|uniref:M56 family metallopeptidase n=1 Tax=Daejeonella sp. TaxID=2805397 RepID=UPI0030C41679
MIVYLLKVNIALLLFYAGYHFILQRYTFHTLNRFYLLVGLVYSALYPFIDLSNILNRNQQLKEQISLLNADWQGSVTYVISRAENGAGNYWQIVLLIFWTGVIFMSLRLMIQLISLLALHIRSSPSTLGNFKFRKISKAVNPFSFWRTIYLNPEGHDASELHTILEHEQVHVKQLHTLDVMLAELSTIFYWFNPGVWLMKKAVKANLEFITDQEVIRSGIDSREYQYTLLKIQVLPQNSIPVNNFHFLTIKKRIAMINKKPSNRINLSNYMLLLPAIMLLVLATGISKGELSKPIVETFVKIPGIQAISRNILPENGAITTQDKTLSVTTDARVVTLQKSLTDTNKVVNGVVVLTGYHRDNSRQRSLIEIDTNVTQKPLYVVDGKAVTNGFGNLASEQIYSITVLKGEGAIRQYGTEAKNGVVEIRTKAAGIEKSSESLKEVTVVGYAQNQNQKITLGDITNQLIFLDGKEITKEMLDDLQVTSIGSVEVFKGASAVTKYGEKAKDGVIVITTKKK